MTLKESLFLQLFFVLFLMKKETERPVHSSRQPLYIKQISITEKIWKKEGFLSAAIFKNKINIYGTKSGIRCEKQEAELKLQISWASPPAASRVDGEKKRLKMSHRSRH